MDSFTLHRPSASDEVVGLLSELGASARIHAGGTDLMVQIRAGEIEVAHVIDLGQVLDLRQIREAENGSIQIGAAATMTDVSSSSIIQRRFPALAEAARMVGSQQIQNRATLVGNVCNASPAADAVPPLHVHDARVRVIGPRGRRSIPIADFASGPRSTCLDAGEWVTGIDLPAHAAGSSAYEKLGRTRGVDLALVGAACRVSKGDVHIAFASVAPTVIRGLHTEAALKEAGRFEDVAGAAVQADITPIDDIRSSARYRRLVAPVIAKRAWTRAVERAKS